MAFRSLRDRTILAVEDDYFLAVNLERDLARMGAVVIGPAPSVAQALALIAAEPELNAAVLDVELGGETSFPVADVLLGRGIPFVFTTGYGDGNLNRRYPQIARFEKPVDLLKLEQALGSLLQPGSATPPAAP